MENGSTPPPFPLHSRQARIKMHVANAPGQIIILNGAPRAGKSSIAACIQATFPGIWMNLGVDAYVRHITPEQLRPGIGLRPGGERPDLEELIPAFYAALYGSIAAHSRVGLNVVADLGHHDSYSKPLGILPRCARLLTGLPVLFVGVHCSLEIIMARRNAGQPGREGLYVQAGSDEVVPLPVELWQQAVHDPGIYDLTVDTSSASAEACAEIIHRQLREENASPTAFERLARMYGEYSQPQAKSKGPGNTPIGT
jgi:chloramphenicol 3-O phosphotransferase